MTIHAPPSPTIAASRRAESEDARSLARVLARGFYDDPAATWFFPRAATRIARLERFFRLVSLDRMALPRGEALMTDDKAATALWMPPGSMQSGRLEEFLLLPGLLRACRGDVRRALRGLAAMDAVHPHEPHWYLALLAVLPERQGQGIGSALLRPVLERCDAEGMPAYLEATTTRNRALYARHGFEVHGVLELPDGGPPLWRMWREPAG